MISPNDLTIFRPNMSAVEISDAYKLLKPFFLFFFSADEELFNDFFCKVIKNVELIDQDKNCFNFLYTIAKNMKIDAYKRKIRENNFEKIEIDPSIMHRIEMDEEKKKEADSMLIDKYNEAVGVLGEYDRLFVEWY